MLILYLDALICSSELIILSISAVLAEEGEGRTQIDR